MKTTLCYILNDNNEVLLIMKKRGVGQGRWNGPGGKVDPDEEIEVAAIREVAEETGLTVKNLEPKGYLEFIAPTKPEIESRCHIFITRDYSGEIIETEECFSQWHKIEELPFEQMWDDDIIWLKDVLAANKEVKYRFYLNQEERLERHEKID